jgi:AcrR family transcriptional regulator
MPRATGATTIDRILSAALRQLAHHGVRRTTMDDIATAADLSRPTLYEYFPNKNAIISAAIGNELDRFLAELDDHGRRATTPVERLATIVAHGYLGLRDHGLVQRLLTTEQATLMPFVTGDAPALAVGYDWAARQICEARGDQEPTDTDRQTAEMLVRVMHSLLLSPPVALDLGDEEATLAWARRWLAPWLAQSGLDTTGEAPDQGP